MSQIDEKLLTKESAMTFKKNVLLEIRALATFLAGAWIIVPIFYAAYQTGHFDIAPVWFIVSFGAFITLLGYAWWRQGLSADKTKFERPPIW